MKTVVVRVVKTQQDNGVDLFSFFLPGELVHELAEISRIHRDENYELEGFQRKEIKRHVSSIIEYLDGGNVLFPNAIILALSPDQVEFKQSRGKNPKGMLESGEIGTLYLPLNEPGNRIAWIVDGQQRSLALAHAERKGIPVPVVAFVAKDLELQRQQFILVNKAKPLPARLINELLPEVDVRLPKDLAIRKIPSELCNLMNRDPDSPFCGMIRRVSSESGDKRKAVVVDTALMTVIKKSIGNPVGALSQFKGFGKEASDVQGMYSVLNSYWGAVKKTFPEAWGKTPQQSRLMHSAGIQAMGVLMDRIMARAQYADSSEKELKKALLKIAPHCCWTSGTWPDLGLKWNEIQNLPRHVRGLSEQLVQLDLMASRRI